MMPELCFEPVCHSGDIKPVFPQPGVVFAHPPNAKLAIDLMAAPRMTLRPLACFQQGTTRAGLNAAPMQHRSTF